MDLRKKLLDIGITDEGYESNDTFIVDFYTSDEYAKIYTILDESEEYDFVMDKSTLDEHNSELFYEGDECYIQLFADFDNDLYKAIVEEK